MSPATHHGHCQLSVENQYYMILTDTIDFGFGHIFLPQILKFIKFDYCQLLINPLELVKFGLLDVGKIGEIYQIGYESACKAISKIDNLEQFQNKVKG